MTEDDPIAEAITEAIQIRTLLGGIERTLEKILSIQHHTYKDERILKTLESMATTVQKIFDGKAKERIHDRIHGTLEKILSKHEDAEHAGDRTHKTLKEILSTDDLIRTQIYALGRIERTLHNICAIAVLTAVALTLWLFWRWFHG